MIPVRQAYDAAVAVRDVEDNIAKVRERPGDLDELSYQAGMIASSLNTVDDDNELVFKPRKLRVQLLDAFGAADDTHPQRQAAERAIKKAFAEYSPDANTFNVRKQHRNAVHDWKLTQAMAAEIELRDAAKAEVARRRRQGRPSIAEQLLDYTALMDRPGLVPLIDGVLFESTLALMAGAPGIGKSFVAVAMACSVATGEDWLGREVASGPVLIIQAEGDAGLGKRVKAWSQAWYKGKPVTALHVYPQSLDMSDTDGDVAELAEVVAELDPALIIFDTLNRVAGGAEENSSTAMSLVLGNIETVRRAGTRTTALVIHHTGKNGDLRGSNALLGNPDTVLELKGDTDSLELKAVKQKDAEGGVIGRYTLAPHYDSLILNGVAPGTGQPSSAQAARIEEALAHFVRAFSDDGCTRPQFVRTLEEWMQVSNSTAHTYVGDLITSGRLVSRHSGRSTRLELPPNRVTFPLDPTSTTN